ncbi:DNA damage and replication checkpoint protein Rfx1, putative [Trichophyton verrucosum HKI 0517]|uniref:DNA damage and replication checkpoint protein Rfx1, putative n=1 Tax=Trichophyton verrucosum (strain HKI 0517) TaxID=663202 RepID=D4DCQ2_TRIVH|nr:DNA damage and replication checkpoint protein Rfx1, putative [Trichophyton verrucosum HKI 0517]EFE40424.1 DNA damage and replication checkpoint protein Rfx1, putative [Trichophyton verrucosum HKI 0517]
MADTSCLPAQTAQKRPRSRQSTIEPMRSRSNTASTKSARLSRSRGSTASIHSVITQYHPDVQQQQQPAPQDIYATYMRSQYPPSQVTYHHPNPEEMILRYGEQFGHATAPPPAPRLDEHTLQQQQESHNVSAVRQQRPDLQLQEHLLRNRNISVQPSQPSPPPGIIPAEFASAHFPQMFDTTENHHHPTPDRMLEDNDGSEVGPRKRRGTSSSIANDNELRRLLRQYDGYSLQDMASEVRKNEGAGGKSEKVKQVFAMIWLRENCQRGDGSVRRDRVYCCYAEKCGNDRVSVLNPASFGKLVRIIFPNVQTRRLGVRGESKYHYVDLSLIGQDTKAECDDKMDKVQDHGLNLDGAASQLESSFLPDSQQTQKSIVDAGDATSPGLNILQQSQPSAPTHRCACADTNVSDINVGVDPMAVKTQLKIKHLLQFEPTDNTPSTDSDTLSLPNIHQYLPDNSDPSAADALAALYRSHCTSVIDSFRFCKEKNLFRHFTAFLGTLTVPVHKLLIHPNVAPWVEECDWIMYQKMLAFVSPLTTQVVPDPVLKAFQSISCKLVTHIAETLKSQPEHVSTARLVPCRLFCHLLKRMLDVNQSAIAAAAWLCHQQNRNKMWEEFSTFVDPTETVIKANIPPCSLKTAITILKEHMKSLLYPLDNCPPPQTDSIDQELAGFQKFPLQQTNNEEYTNFPDRWITFILQLPAMFPNHSATCIIEKADALWTTALHRLTLSNAESFSAWWMTKVFFLEMMHWQAERGGFMATSPRSLREHSANLLNKPTATVAAQLASFASTNHLSSQQTETEQSTQEAAPNVNQATSNTAAKTIKADVPNRPAVDTSLEGNQINNDDSAIALEEDSVLLGTTKYTDMTLSDPADAEGDVIVV